MKEEIAEQDRRTTEMIEQFKTEMRGQLEEQEARITRQDAKIAEQEETILSQGKTVLEQDKKIRTYFSGSHPLLPTDSLCILSSSSMYSQTTCSS